MLQTRFLFGLGYGFVIVSFASVAGASCAFLVGRFFARDWVASQLASVPRFAALDAAIEERGALIVFLTRLSPIFPFNLLNYALGLTAVRFWTFVGVPREFPNYFIWVSTTIAEGMSATLRYHDFDF